MKRSKEVGLPSMLKRCFQHANPASVATRKYPAADATRAQNSPRMRPSWYTTLLAWFTYTPNAQ